jgi:hypothetical protein
MNDPSIRAAMKRDLLVQHRSDAKTVIIDELAVHRGAARIDLAVVNGVLHGFELKSDRDTLTRLPVQAQAFSAVFDFVTLVMAERHVRQALEMVPEWWGIRSARFDSGEPVFCDLKSATTNPSPDPMSIAALLWRDEALAFLDDLESAKGMHSKSRSQICLRLVEKACLDDLRDRVRLCLRDRQDWRSAGTRLSCGD